jgi:Rieske Fe-S protein
MNERRRFLEIIGGTVLAAGVGCGAAKGSSAAGGGGGSGGSGGEGGAGGMAGADGSAGPTCSAGGASSNGTNNDECQSDRGVFNVGKPADYPTAGLYKVSDLASNVLIGRDGAGLYALSSLCTHQCCDLNASQGGLPYGTFTTAGGQKVLQCNCHGSQFAYDGTVVRGPALRPLTAYQLDLGCDGVLYADTATPVSSARRLAV